MTGRTPALVASLTGVALMLTAILVAGVAGSFPAELKQLATMPWGIVTLIDIYVGFILFAAWVACRERSLLAVAAWIIAIMALGNLMTCAYVAFALWRHGDDAHRFWMGERA